MGRLTSIPAAKARLLELLADLDDVAVTAGPEPVSVTSGPQKHLPEVPAAVYVLGSENIERRPVADFMRESYDVRIVVAAAAPEKTGTQLGVESALWDIVGQIEQLVSADARLAEDVVDSYFAPREENSGFTDGRWRARLLGAVHVEAELT